MNDLYTQAILRAGRFGQIAGALKSWNALVFPPLPGGRLLCEKLSETTDLRIIGSMAQMLSRHLRTAALAVAGDAGSRFWCALFENGKVRFEHNQLIGPRDWGTRSAEPGEVHELCRAFGKGDATAEVQALLADPRYERAIDRHAALVEALGLPAFSPGVGYARAAAGGLGFEGPPPARTLREVSSEPGYTFEALEQLCRSSFGFLVDELGFRELPASPGGSHAGPFFFGYESRHLFVFLEVDGPYVHLYLVDRKRRFLDLDSLVERRDPERLDLCSLAMGPGEQIPNFAAALRDCAADLLAGDLSVAPPAEPGTGFVFGAGSARILEYCRLGAQAS